MYLHDLAHAVRSLRRHPGFLVAAVGTLAIGICANVTVFSLLNALLLRPMPFGGRTDRVVTLHSAHRLQAEDWDNSGLSYPDLLDVRLEARSFEQVGGFIVRNFTVRSDTDAERLLGLSVTPEVFPLLGVEPRLGRNFTAEEAAPLGLEASVILTHGVWQRHYGGDPAIIGRTITINDRARTVVGVTAPGFGFPNVAQLYMPLRLDEGPRADRSVAAIALLKPGVTLDQAQADVDAVAARLESTHPANRGYGIRVLSFRDSQVDQRAWIGMGMLMTAVVFVLLIACANLANLLFVRGAARQRDMAVRAALGASRGRLMGHVLAESAVVAIAGTALGTLGAMWWLRAIPATWPEEFPYWFRLDPDIRIAAFTVALTVLTTVAVGLLPAIRVSRPRVAHRLAEGGRGASLGRSSHRIQQGLAVAQVALCLALLVGAHLMIRSFLSIQRAELGFDERPLLSMRVFLSGDAFDPVPARAAFFERVVGALRALPGVTAAAATTSIPGDDGGVAIRITAAAGTGENAAIGAHAVTATPDLLDALGLRMRAGRTFTAPESSDASSDVAIVNDALARRLWPHGSALERRIGIVTGDGVSWRRVIGVAPDLVYEELSEQTDQSRLIVYVPYARMAPRTMALLVRTDGGDPAALIAPARQALRRVHAGLAVYDVLTMSDRKRSTGFDYRVFGTMMGGFAAAALLLACLGIYALLADTARQRTHEIGVRLALGASPRTVVSLFLTQGAMIGAAGLTVGLVLALGVARALGGVLFGIDPFDPVPMALTAAALMAVVLLAAYVPARRAAHVDPVVALRIV